MMSNTRKSISKEMTTILENFSLETIVRAKAVNTAAKMILREIQIFNQIEEKQQAEHVINLRKSLLNFYHDKELPITFLMDMDFKKLLCNILITLAEQFPINEIDVETGLPIDPVSYLPIEKDDQFWTIAGQIFSINSIIDYNKTRLPREDSLGEQSQGKFLLNPLTNQPFLPIDMERLIIIASRRRKNLDFIIDQPSESKMTGADLFSQKHFSLKDFVSILNGTPKDINVDIIKELKYRQEDAFACMLQCASNGEEKTYEHLYVSLQQQYKDLLTQSGKYEIHQIISPSSANAFICILTIYNEPKTLKRIADLMLAAGLDLNHQYQAGIGAIHLAAQFGSVEAMKVLLDPKYNINLRNSTGATAINIAAHHKQINAARILAERGANLMIPQHEGLAPIHIAAEHDNIELLQLLLEHKVNIDQKSGFFCWQKTAAHLAAEYNSMKVTKMLLDSNADFNKTDEGGLSPLALAAYHGSTDVMQLLLQCRDRVLVEKAVDDRWPHTVASIAAERGHVSILKLLAASKVDLDKPHTDDGTTPLHRAVLKGHYVVSAFLITHYLMNDKSIFVKHKSGLSPGFSDKRGLSPFFFACSLKKWDIAKLFLNKVKDEEIPPEDKEEMNNFREELGLSESSSVSNGQLLATLGLHSSSMNTTSNNEGPHNGKSFQLKGSQ